MYQSASHTKIDLEKYTEYCIEQEESNVKVSQEDFINWVAEVNDAVKISLEMINKSFNSLGFL